MRSQAGLERSLLPPTARLAVLALSCALAALACTEPAAPENPDLDGDGYLNAQDAFPTDASEHLDHDGDRIGDNADLDDDGDGVPDLVDTFPLDATESADHDGDGVGDRADPDDDGDGVLDALDAFPLDPTESSDHDGDGVGDDADPDADGDQIADDVDIEPLNGHRPNAQPPTIALASIDRHEIRWLRGGDGSTYHLERSDDRLGQGFAPIYDGGATSQVDDAFDPYGDVSYRLRICDTAGCVTASVVTTPTRVRRVSGPGVLSTGTGSRTFRFTPDGSHLVFSGDFDDDGSSELLSSALDGQAPPIRLSGGPSFPRVTHVSGFDEDGSHVIYVGRNTLVYRTPIDRSETPQLLVIPSFGVTGGELSGALTHDGRFLYVEDEDGVVGSRIFIVPLDGSTLPLDLTTTLTSPSMWGPQLAGATGRVVVRAMPPRVSPERTELYSIADDASAAPIALSGPFANGRGVVQFVLSADGTRAIYSTPDEAVTLHAVPTDGSSPPIAVSMARTGTSVPLFVDAGRTAYAFLDNEFLWVAPTDGSASPHWANTTVRSGAAVHAPEFSPDGRLLYYTHEETVAGRRQWEAFVSPVDGLSAPVSLARGPVTTRSHVASRDGSTAVVEEGARNYSFVSSDGHRAPITVDPPFPVSNNGVRESLQTAFTEDRFLLLEGYIEPEFLGFPPRPAYLSHLIRIYAARIDGSRGFVRVSGDVGSGLVYPPFELSPDGRHLAYRAESIESGKLEYYVVDLTALDD